MSKCEHVETQTVWSTVNANGDPLEGGRQLRQQCMDCGKLLAKLRQKLDPGRCEFVEKDGGRAAAGYLTNFT